MFILLFRNFLNINIIPRQNIFPWSLLDNYYFKGENIAFYIADVFFSSLGQITIVTLGPLTNIALAMKLNKSFERNVKNLVIMGGTMEGVGSITPTSGLLYIFLICQIISCLTKQLVNLFVVYDISLITRKNNLPTFCVVVKHHPNKL